MLVKAVVNGNHIWQHLAINVAREEPVIFICTNGRARDQYLFDLFLGQHLDRDSTRNACLSCARRTYAYDNIVKRVANRGTVAELVEGLIDHEGYNEIYNWWMCFV